MFSFLTRQILVWSTNGILCLILTPFGIYNLYIYHKFRDKMQLNKRHHTTVICLVVFILIFWTIERTIGLIWSSNIFGKSFLLTIIHYLIFSFTIYGILWSLVWRYWLVYYDIQFAICSSNSKWKQILNPKYDETEWYIVNKQTFGNQIWCYKCCVFLYLITSILSFLFHLMAVMQIYSQQIAIFTDGAMNLLTFLALYIIWKKTPKFEDKFYIRYELKIIIYSYITLYIWYFIGNLVNSLIQIDEFMFNLISSYIAILTTVIFVYICTRWILNKFAFQQDLEWNKSVSFSRTVTFSVSAVKSPKRSLTVSDAGSKLRLSQLLKDNQGLHCFCNHLIYEFSQECLLSFIEFVQWKTSLHHFISDNSEIFNRESIENILLINEILNNKLYVKSPVLLKQNSESMSDISIMINDNKNNLYYKTNILLFQFPDKVPLSYIVKNIKYNVSTDTEQNTETLLNNEYINNIIYDYKVKAYCLYNKYIFNRNGCDLEINIPCSTRHKLIKLMPDLNIWMCENIKMNELYELFDECIEEMYKLMKDSFNRFKHTEEFLHLDQQIFSLMKSV